MLLLPDELEKLVKYRIDYDKETQSDIVHMYFNTTGWFGRKKTIVETYKLARRTSKIEDGNYTYSMRHEFETLINQLEEYVKLKFDGYKLSRINSRDWMEYQLEKEVLSELDESSDK